MTAENLDLLRLLHRLETMRLALRASDLPKVESALDGVIVQTQRLLDKT